MELLLSVMLEWVIIITFNAVQGFGGGGSSMLPGSMHYDSNKHVYYPLPILRDRSPPVIRRPLATATTTTIHLPRPSGNTTLPLFPPPPTTPSSSLSNSDVFVPPPTNASSSTPTLAIVRRPVPLPPRAFTPPTRAPSRGPAPPRRVPPTPPPKVAKVKCLQGLGFPSRTACVEACFFNRSVSMEGVKSYRIIWANATDNTTKFGTETVQDFIKQKQTWELSNETHGICYPLSMKFIVCDKIALSRDKVMYSNATHTLQIQGFKDTIDVDEFYKFRRRRTTTVLYALCKTALKHKTIVREKRMLECIASAVSLVFLVFAVLLNACVKNIETRKNQLLQRHIIMMTLGFGAMTIQLSGINKVAPICDITVYLQHYFFVSAFCWMNVQSLDMCLTLNGRALTPFESKNRSRRYLFYSLFGFGFPAVVSAGMLAMQMTGSKEIDENDKMPMQELFQYWSDRAILLQYSLMVASLAFNLVLFVIIVVLFQRAGKCVSMVNKGIHLQLLKVCVKLVIAMGFAWIFKIITFFHRFVHNENFEQQHVAKQPWLIYFDVFSNLSGLLVFLVYFCNRRLLHKLCQSCCNLFGKAPKTKRKKISCQETPFKPTNEQQTKTSSSGYENPAISLTSEMNTEDLNKT